jgi:hypothetical protein
LKCSSIDEVLENFHVPRDQVQAVLDFAAKSAASYGARAPETALLIDSKDGPA